MRAFSKEDKELKPKIHNPNYKIVKGSIITPNILYLPRSIHLQNEEFELVHKVLRRLL